MSRKLRIAWFSPLSPDGSKAAYATRLLLPKLEPHCKIDLYHDRMTTFEGRVVAPFLSAFDKHAHLPYDLFFYQLEDGRHSYFSRIHLGLIPGVVWFHDLFLSDYGPEPILNSAWQETVATFRDASHPWCAHDMKHTPKGPHAYRETALAGVRIFSSERDHNEYRRCMEGGLVPTSSRSYLLPLPVDRSRVQMGGRRGVENVRTVVAFCGAPRIEFRAEMLLEAVQAYGDGVTFVWLIDSSERHEVDALLADTPIKNVTVVEGRTPERWQTMVTNADIAVHTLFSVYGQLGPYLNISLAAGVPCAVCNFGQGELLPDALLLKISCGDAARSELRELIGRAKELYAATHSRVASYGAEMFDLQVVASELLDVFEASRPTLASLSGRWKAFEGGAKRVLAQEAKSHFHSDLFGTEAIDEVYRELGWE